MKGILTRFHDLWHSRGCHHATACVIGIFACLANAPFAHGQFVYYEDFGDTQAEGWELVQDGSSPGPRLTGGLTPGSSDPEFGDPQVDSVGNGWMRLATTTNNQANAIFLDFAIPAAGTSVTTTFDFTMWDDVGSADGGDGLVVFVQDFDSAFVPGAAGGSLGYAQKTGDPGVPDGFFGVGFDVYGNYSNPTEGRVGGPGGDANAVAIRGPGSGTGGYDYVAGTGDVPGDLEGIVPGTNDQLDYFNLDSRPDQDAEQYRRARVELDENDILTVWVEFGYGTGFVQLVSADLSSYGTRPEEFRLGFSAGTGGATQVYEIRNLEVQVAGGANAAYWDDQAKDGSWGSGNNWDNNVVPTAKATVFFSDYYASNDSDRTIDLGTNRTVGNILLGGVHSYTLNGNILIMEADTGSSSSAISVLKDRDGDADHSISSHISMQNNLDINQFTNQTLTLAGAIDTNGFDLRFDSFGDILASGIISDTGDVLVAGPGRTIFSANNSYSGLTTIESGTLRIENSGSLGNTSAGTIVQDSGTLELFGGLSVSSSESLTLEGTGSDGFGALTSSGGTNVWNGNITLANDTTIGSLADTLRINSTSTFLTNGYDLTLYAADGTILRIEDLIDDGSGTSDLIKIGQGTFELLNNQTYDGQTLIQEGTFLLRNSSARLGSTTGGTVVSSGATLAFQSNANIASGESLTVTGDGAPGTAALWVISGTTEVDAPITITGGFASFGAASGTLNLDGIISGADQDVFIRGNGIVAFANSMTYTGDTFIESGTLRYRDSGNRINDNSNVTVSAGATYDLTNSSYNDTIGSLAGAGTVNLRSATLTAGVTNLDTTFSGTFLSNGTFVKQGTGNMTLSGTVTNGPTFRVDNGTLTLGANDVFNDAVDLTLNGGTFAIDGFSDTLDSFTLQSSSSFDFLGQPGGFLTFDDMTRSNGQLTIDNWIGSLTGGGDTRLLVTASSLGGSLLSNIEFSGFGDADLINVSPGLYEIVPNLSGWYEWDGSTDNLWDDNTNWTVNGGTPGTFPDNNTSDVLIADNVSSGGNINFPTSNYIEVRRMIIDTDTDFTLGNSSSTADWLDFRSNTGESFLTILGSSEPTFVTNVYLWNDAVIRNNSTAVTTFEQPIWFTGTTSGLQLTFDGSGTTILNNEISEEGAPSGDVLKKGTGTLQLNAANSDLSGTFTLESGALQIGNDFALGIGDFILNGGSLEAFGANSTLANAADFNADFSVNGSHILTFNGTADLNSGSRTITVGSGAGLTLGGVVSGTADLVSDGAGDIVLSNASNTFSGNLTQSGSGTLFGIRQSAGNFTFGSTVSGENLLGTGTTFTVNSGSAGATLEGGGTLAITAPATLNINGGTAEFTNFDPNNPVTTHDFSFAGTANLTGGILNFNSSRDLTFTGDSLLSATSGTANFSFDDDFITTGTSSDPATFDISGNATVNLLGNNPAGSDVAIDSDTIWNVDGANASLNISQETGSSGEADLAGRMNLTNGGTLSVSGMTTVLSAETQIDAGTGAAKGLIQIDGDLSVDEPSLANLPNITINNATATLITAPNADSSLTNVGTLTKTGAGTTTINSSINNIQAAQVVIEGGTLLLGDSDQLANTNAMILAGGTFATAGNDEIIASLTLNANSTIDLGSGNSVLEYTGTGTRNAGQLFIESWSGDLDNGGGTDQIIFGTNLNSAFLSNVVWKDLYGPGQDAFGSRLIDLGDGRYELVPVPEPRFYIGAALLLSLVLLHWRRTRLPKHHST